MSAAVGCGSALGSCVQLKDYYSSRRKNMHNNNNNNRKNGFRVSCVYSAAVSTDPYKTLRIHPGASESEVKKAFRQLALQYHPDVCRGSNCGVQFHQINEAYDRHRRMVACGGNSVGAWWMVVESASERSSCNGGATNKVREKKSKNREIKKEWEREKWC